MKEKVTVKNKNSEGKWCKGKRKSYLPILISIFWKANVFTSRAIPRTILIPIVVLSKPIHLGWLIYMSGFSAWNYHLLLKYIPEGSSLFFIFFIFHVIDTGVSLLHSILFMWMITQLHTPYIEKICSSFALSYYLPSPSPLEILLIWLFLFFFFLTFGCFIFFITFTLLLSNDINKYRHFIFFPWI